MSDEPRDQPTYTMAIHNGVIFKNTSATLKAANVANSVYVFSHDYTYRVSDHQVIQYRKGVSYFLTAAEITKLTALSAPMALA
jgi:hypothetical protein